MSLVKSYKTDLKRQKNGTIVLFENGNRINCIWSFSSHEERIKVTKEANNRVLNNQNVNVTYQVQVFYGYSPVEIAALWL